jgi:hypothetical protein
VFNAISKLDTAQRGAWIKILHAVPDSVQVLRDPNNYVSKLIELLLKRTMVANAMRFAAEHATRADTLSTQLKMRQMERACSAASNKVLRGLSALHPRPVAEVSSPQALPAANAGIGAGATATMLALRLMQSCSRPNRR